MRNKHIMNSISVTIKMHVYLSRCLENGQWSHILGCHPIPKKKECCKEITFYYKPKRSGFSFLEYFGTFLGIWVQVGDARAIHKM